MIVYTTQFGGALFDGTEPPGFTERIRTNTTKTQSVSSTNNVGGRVLSINPSGDGYQVYEMDRSVDGNQADADILFLFQYPSVIGSSYLIGGAARASGTSTTEEGYWCLLNNSNNRIYIIRSDAGVQTQIANSLSVAPVIDVWYWFHFRIEGSLLQGKCWEYGTTPPSWQVEVTDTTYTEAGWFGLSPYSTNAVEIDYLSIATGGYHAKMPYVVPVAGNLNTITAYPQSVRADSTSLLVFTGEPNRSVNWTITAGDGTLTVLTDYTSNNGNAFAKYTPGTPDTTATVQAEYGTL